jgi:hypothetical protein
MALAGDRPALLTVYPAACLVSLLAECPDDCSGGAFPGELLQIFCRLQSQASDMVAMMVGVFNLCNNLVQERLVPARL